MSPFQYHGSYVESMVCSMNLQTLYGSEALIGLTISFQTSHAVVVSALWPMRATTEIQKPTRTRP